METIPTGPTLWTGRPYAAVPRYCLTDSAAEWLPLAAWGAENHNPRTMEYADQTLCQDLTGAPHKRHEVKPRQRRRRMPVQLVGGKSHGFSRGLDRMRAMARCGRPRRQGAIPASIRNSRDIQGRKFAAGLGLLDAKTGKATWSIGRGLRRPAQRNNFSEGIRGIADTLVIATARTLQACPETELGWIPKVCPGIDYKEGDGNHGNSQQPVAKAIHIRSDTASPGEYLPRWTTCLSTISSGYRRGSLTGYHCAVATHETGL